MSSRSRHDPRRAASREPRPVILYPDEEQRQRDRNHSHSHNHQTQAQTPPRSDSRPPNDDFPPLPQPRVPAIPELLASGERHRYRRDWRDWGVGGDPLASSSAAGRPPSRYWNSTAVRRAERIRNLEDRPPAFLEDWTRASDASWNPASRNSARLGSHSLPPVRTPSDFEGLDRSLNEANSQLRALLDITTAGAYSLPPSMPPLRSPPHPRTHDSCDDNRRNKRRKLEGDRQCTSTRSYRYGKYGQIEPGQLRMEMVTCDGGMFSTETAFAAANILENDASVYCTKGNRCNIVLRHQGSSIFTLKELVVKAPETANYSHPVREGLVFVVMDQDEALSRTAQFQIQYRPRDDETPLPRDDPWDDRDPRNLDLADVISIRHHHDGSTSRRARRPSRHRSYAGDDDDDDRAPQLPREFSANVPDFSITTECSDTTEEDADTRTSRPPNRWPPHRTPDSDEEGGNPYSDDLDSFSRRRMRARRRDLADAWEASASATQEAVRAVGGELLSPHARFFIEKKKSKCTIRFDPPVTGRYILLKMWSTQNGNGNIDIQSVMAHGYAGPRYFPAMDLR